MAKKTKIQEVQVVELWLNIDGKMLTQKEMGEMLKGVDGLPRIQKIKNCGREELGQPEPMLDGEINGDG